MSVECPQKKRKAKTMELSFLFKMNLFPRHSLLSPRRRISLSVASSVTCHYKDRLSLLASDITNREDARERERKRYMGELKRKDTKETEREFRDVQKTAKRRRSMDRYRMSH